MQNNFFLNPGDYQQVLYDKSKSGFVLFNCGQNVIIGAKFSSTKVEVTRFPL